LRALFDINVLLALHDGLHLHHKRSEDWWLANREPGWASCPLTQNGFVRIASQPAYANRQPLQDALARLRSATQGADHAFWPDDVSILDPAVVDHTRIFGPNQITDVYLLALAVRHGGRLVTFDGAIPVSAVRGARPEHLVVL